MLQSVIHGKVVKVNLAKAMKVEANPNRAGKFKAYNMTRTIILKIHAQKIVWESEEWLKEHAKPLDESNGQGVRASTREDAMEE
jgi:hypothetical protein